ncbi:hypothetical protein JTB14_023567 [Gonioctena quinquepunctata]|nr:hypothetical protein JTB14_023567 [Gonioctena quinquepunctata]
MGFVVWITLCVMVCFWFLSKFAKGRRQFQTNLHVIEDGLRKMQEELELREREKSIGCVDDVEDISSFLQKFHEPDDTESKNQEETEAEENMNEKPISEENPEVMDEDKKHI